MKVLTKVGLLLSVLCVIELAVASKETDLWKAVSERYTNLDEAGAIRLTKLLLAAEESGIESKEVNLTATPVPFTCVPHGPSPTVPTSVHQLRPADIKVVAALGDSITAAFGAKAGSIFTVFTEYRGVSWSIGGDDNVKKSLTMPNILKEYNPKLIGYSLKTGKETSDNSKLNVAVSGAIVQDMPGQVDTLIKKMKATTSINFNEDWKVVTVFIGGNNLCDYCSDRTKHSPDEYEKNIRETFRRIRNGIPRVFVNMVLVIDVTKLYAVSSGFCSLLHAYECKCGTTSDAKVRAEVAKVAEEYNNRVYKVRDEAEFNNKDDFTVVIQPFMVDTQVPLKSGKPDTSYFAPDCFHFSYLAHEAAAVALWDNMVEPVGRKRTKWTIGEPIECPGATEVLATNQNSKNSTLLM